MTKSYFENLTIEQLEKLLYASSILDEFEGNHELLDYLKSIENTLEDEELDAVAGGVKPDSEEAKIPPLSKFI